MRLYYGKYGHHLSGQLYAYWGSDNLRTGQQVVAPVTAKNGKIYNTMFTIATSRNEKNAQEEVDRLESKGIEIKTISGRDTLSLPGAQGFNYKTEWKRDSETRYEERMAARRSLLSKKQPSSDTTPQKDRLRSMMNKKYE